MEEITHGSHIHKLAGNSNSPNADQLLTTDFTTMEIDSLSARYNQTHSMTEDILEEDEAEVDDSLNFNLQETVDEDSLTGGGCGTTGQDLAGNSNISDDDDEDYYEHDSLQV